MADEFRARATLDDLVSAKFKSMGINSQQAFDKMSSDAKRFGSTVKSSFGRALKSMIGFAAGFLAFRKLSGIISDSIRLFGVQEEAIAKVESTIRSTGGAAGVTSKELQKMAAELQSVTTIGDEVILRGQSMLLTFKKIGKDVFPRATETMLDLSIAMGTDVKESAIQLGKALNDPTTGLTALRRVGITFNKTQEDTIKHLQKTGDIAAAQGLILEELESQFGGLARAVADTGTGQLKQFQNIVGDVKEQLGKALLPVILENVTAFKDWISKAQESGKLERIFNNISSAFKTLSDNINNIIKIGKIFFTVFAISKILALTNALRTMTLTLSSINPALVAITAGLIAIDGAMGFLNKKIEDLEGKGNVFTSLADSKELQKAVLELENMNNLVSKYEEHITAAGGNILKNLHLIKEQRVAFLRAAEAQKKIEEIGGKGFKTTLRAIDSVVIKLEKEKQLRADVLKAQKEAVDAAKAAAKAAAGTVDGTGDIGNTDNTDKQNADADRKIQAAQDLQDRLYVMTLEAKERDLAELQDWVLKKSEILSAGGEDEAQLMETFKIKRDAINKKWDDKALADKKKIDADKKRLDNKSLADEKRLNDTIKSGKEALTDALISQSSRGLQLFIKNEKAAKKVAFAASVIQGFVAVQRALSNPPGPPFTIPQSVATGIMAAGNSAAIASQALRSGGFPSGRNALIRVNEDGQESVLNARATSNIGAGGINSLNSGQSIKNTTINNISFAPTINAGGGDNRLITELLNNEKPAFVTFVQEEIFDKGYIKMRGE